MNGVTQAFGLGRGIPSNIAPNTGTPALAYSSCTATSATFAVSGAGQFQLLYRKTTDSSWTRGETLEAAGAVTQADLDDSARYEFLAYTTDALGNLGQSPSNSVFVTLSDA